MPCMCGDLYCWSCGPAQGNWKCEICGKWAEDGGCENPDECEKKGQELAKIEAEEYEKDRKLEQEGLEIQRENEPQPCPHGKEVHECNECMIASDLAYDAQRENRRMGRF